jgi:Ser/Thr protein kinase RdoA (MazF antagonist)
MERIKALGRMTSDMHFTLSEMPKVNLPSVYSEYLSIIVRMRKYFFKPDVLSAMNKKLGFQIDASRLFVYENELNACRIKSGQQALHMDFVRGNILFQGDKISGVLDFEKTALGHPIVDVARTLAFLLVDCKYKTEEKVRKYFLHSGYQKRGMNKNLDTDNLEILVELFLFYDLYKFLLHNPYESLELNEHFMRTKDILVKYGVILLGQQKGVKV